MANKAQYLVFTRFYKGEENCPVQTANRCNNGKYLWEIERDWVNASLANKLPGELIEDYARYVDPMVNAQYGIPVSLLAYIFHRIAKWKQSIIEWGHDFAEFIEKEYLV